MILEALNYAATWPLTGPDSRRAIRASVNLCARAGRCARDWADHEEKTKTAILQAAARCRQKRTAVVLGSGLLRDVPIVELARLFDTVVLVDLVHLASVRAWLMLKRLRHVRLIERDLSGYAALTTGDTPEPLGFLRQVPYLDLVVSANLLSQIATGTKRRLEADPAGGQPDTVIPALVAAHLDALAAVPASTCLVTDIGYRVVDRGGKMHEEVDLMRGAILPPERAEWDWPVVPFGEESPDYQVVHRVIVI
ncbi:hypothetical protein [Rhizobium halophytocola]|uniref:Class I SAM-dependent methyltransferase n=1 Tax=Rhizobium halophytocola TaxID=735519 RepID=A0ABS4DXQ4_9HYPH|nr:hypothetical protein [Rhizobium halophytocola]MBP1850476.1 hypothetical protein [Rhizobium halophytocola]